MNKEDCKELEEELEEELVGSIGTLLSPLIACNTPVSCKISVVVCLNRFNPSQVTVAAPMARVPDLWKLAQKSFGQHHPLY